MSLIFEALKKLQDQPIAGKAYRRPSKKVRRATPHPKPFFRPWLIAGIALCVLVVVCGIFFRPASKEDRAPIESTRTPVRLKPGPDISFQAKRSDGRSVSATEEQKGGVADVEFLPAGQKDPALEATQANSDTARRQVTEGRNRLETVANPSAEGKAAVPMDTSPADKTKKRFGTVETAGMTTQPRVERVKQPQLSRQTASRRSAEERTIRNKIDQQARVIRLVARIYASMDQGLNDRTRSLIEELAQLKGHDNEYVLKLKAYWHLRNEEYDSAVALLEKVIARDTGDLEAGINMAIAEMKTHRYQAAQERLAALRQAHPENNLIPELMHKLR